jgi:hypothetical protein
VTVVRVAHESGARFLGVAQLALLAAVASCVSFGRNEPRTSRGAGL